MVARKFNLWLVTFGVVYAMHADANTRIRCGQVTGFRLAEEAAMKWNTDEYGDTPTLDAGEKFAIVTIKLAPNRSIGKYDYTLAGNRCLAMALNQDPYDPSYWEQRHRGNHDEIHLLYKVPESGAPFSFEFQLTNREKPVFLPGESNESSVTSTATSADVPPAEETSVEESSPTDQPPPTKPETAPPAPETAKPSPEPASAPAATSPPATSSGGDDDW